jgi:hypothetical protein
MSKPTETTNECVPRDIVRIGTTVGKRRETHDECWETHGSVGKHTEAWGSVAETCGTLGTRGRGVSSCEC